MSEEMRCTRAEASGVGLHSLRRRNPPRVRLGQSDNHDDEEFGSEQSWSEKLSLVSDHRSMDAAVHSEASQNFADITLDGRIG